MKHGTLLLLTLLTGLFLISENTAYGQSFRVSTDTVCNVDTGNTNSSSSEKLSFTNIPDASGSVTVTFRATGDLPSSSTTKSLIIQGEYSQDLDTLLGPANCSSGNYDSVTFQVNQTKFNNWVDDDSVTFTINPTSSVSPTCNCTSECDQSKPNCGSSSVSYKAAIKLEYRKLDAFQRAYGDTLAEQGEAITLASDGKPVLAGFTESFGQGKKDAFLLKTDKDGKQEWFKTYGSAGNEVALDVIPRQDSSGFLVTGYTDTLGKGKDDIFVIKTDAQGNVVWEQTYGDTLNERPGGIIQTQDGNYVVGGYTESFGASGKDVYLVAIWF
jgi:hypothetical protein